MKVAVSIPDDVFERAEGMVRRLGTSRSNLYARAINEMLERQEDDLTAAFNTVIDEVGREPDPFVREAGRKIFAKLARDEKW